MVVMSSYNNFIHLRLRSSHSLLEGTLTPDNIVSLCKKYSMPAVAITDNNNLFASLEFSQTLSKNGIQPIIGCLLKVKIDDDIYIAPIYVMNDVGYKNLLKLMQIMYGIDCRYSISIEELCIYNKGLILFVGAYDSYLNYIAKNSMLEHSHLLDSHISLLKKHFNKRIFVEIIRTGDYSLENEIKILDIAYKYDLPLVATNDIYFDNLNMYEAHDALICIAEQTYVSVKDRRKISEESYFKSSRDMCRLFSDLPEAIENTIYIAKQCLFFVGTRKAILPSFSNDLNNEDQELITRSYSGLENILNNRFSKKNNFDTLKKEYFSRLDYELKVIIKMKFAGYFLIVSDFIKWSKNNNIPVGPGRGSGAGCLVAWALDIIDIDPIEYGLIFERFLNPERISMPDFDIDFCQNRRDEVIEYVRNKYGANKVAQIITFGKLQARAVLRDVGRVLQMPYGQVDMVCKLVPNNPSKPCTLHEALKVELELKKHYKNSSDIRKLINIAMQLEGLNRHSSTHAAGIVIGDRALSELVPMYSDSKSDMAIIQYSMKYAEMSGLIKFDFLGLKTLTVIDNALKLLKSRGLYLDINNIDLKDKTTYELLNTGNTNGVFQIEGTGMQAALKEMQAHSINDIIALISLYRPGPMDNLPMYIAYKNGQQQIEYPHPMLEDILKETYGIIIYQEQVLKIAQIMGGYTLGAADLLRRAMGKKIQSEMDEQRNIFVRGAIGNGVEEKKANEIFDLVAKFAGYGFNKSHAAAYATIAYQTAYLKANYTTVFFVASMNLELNDTDKLAMFCRDAKLFNIKILNPDINKSQNIFTIEELTDGTLAIRYALRAIKNVGISMVNDLLLKRKQQGSFTDIFDLFARCSSKHLNKRQMEYLIKSGALDSLKITRKSLLEYLDILLNYGVNIDNEQNTNQASLFSNEVQKPKINPKLEDDPIKCAYNEFEAFGFLLNNHPLNYYNKELQELAVTSACDINTDSNQQFTTAGVIVAKKIRTSKRGKYAFLQLSDRTGSYDVAIFDGDLLSNSIELINSHRVLIIESVVKISGNATRLVATVISDIEDYQYQKVKSRKNQETDLVKASEVTINIEYAQCQYLYNELNKLKKGNTMITVNIDIGTDKLLQLVINKQYDITTDFANKFNCKHQLAIQS